MKLTTLSSNLLVLTVSLIALFSANSAHALSNSCGHYDGMVSGNTHMYEYVNNAFTPTSEEWADNYYARIIKKEMAPLYGSDKSTPDQEFYLVTISDSNGCDDAVEWVRASDFITLP